MTAIFNRLVGLETEYAIRYHPPEGGTCPPYPELYKALLAALRQKLPSADSSLHHGGVYLANGGAVYLTQLHWGDHAGLIEGCTPECRGPRQLLPAQRAQDRLLSETARAVAPGFRLLKNCRDPNGETYGAQENYSVLVATGWRLTVWRLAWVPLYGLLLAGWVALFVIFLSAVLTNLVVGGLLYLLVCLCLQPDEDGRRRWRGRLLGPAWEKWPPDDEGAPCPTWMIHVLFGIIQVLLAPPFLLTSWLVGLMPLRRTERLLTAFLASRAVLGGSGWLAPDGHFHLTEKAQTRHTLWTDVIPDLTRPIFSVAQFVKAAGPFKTRWKELLAPRQRLQICLGDSNLCPEAEYLRVATTLLVLDAIEAGALTTAPLLRRPMTAIRQISRDANLTHAVAVRGGGRMTALEIQRWYLDACRQFVAATPDAPAEAWEVLRLWGEVLDKLQTDRRALVGRLDWVTKQFLLDEAGADLPHAARKKIDLCYHELSPDGYFARLQAAGLTAPVVSETEVEQAMRLPPTGSPAWQRARYIREFSGGGVLSMGWSFLTVRGADGAKTRIDLHDAAE
jgi:proteasome accessory factor A